MKFYSGKTGWGLFAILTTLFCTLGMAQEPLKVGSAAPDFEIQSLDGKMIKLSAMSKPVVLLFSRANW